MDWQRPIALAIVAGTAVAMAWRPLRRRFGPRRWRLEKDLPCACAGAGGPPPPGLVVSGRRGEHQHFALKSAPTRQS